MKLPEIKKPSLKTLIIIGLIILATVSVYAMLRQRLQKTQDSQPAQPISPQPTASLFKTPRAKQTYLLNSIKNSHTPVTGYSWYKNKIIYSNPDGIYQAATNATLIQAPISNISWGANGSAAYQSNSVWYLFNPQQSTSTPLSISSDKISISPDGQYLASINGSKIELLNTASQAKVSVDLKNPIQSAFLASQTNTLAISQKLPDSTAVQILDENLSIKDFLGFNSETDLLAISPDATKLALSEPEKLIIKELQGSTSAFDLQQSSSAKATWISDNRLILIETFRDQYGRKVDEIWQIDDEMNKDLLTSSMFIPRRLNIDTALYANQFQTVLPLVEKQSTLWMLALIPDKLPDYTTSGLYLLEFGTGSHPYVFQ